MQIPIPIRRVGKSLSSNSPTILSGLAIAGVVATAVLAVRATPKAVKKIQEVEVQKNAWTQAQALENEEDLANVDFLPPTPIEKVKATWQLYLPAAVTGTATIACIIGSNQIGMRRNIALAGAYTLVENAFRQYKDEVLEQIGPKKELAVRDAVITKQVEQNPPPKNVEVIMIGGGEVLCYESLSGRYFRSDAESIRRAVNDFNQDLLNNTMYADLNLWFDLLGLDHTAMGGVVGWSVERKLDIHFTSGLTGNHEPFLGIGYLHDPFEDYGKL